MNVYLHDVLDYNITEEKANIELRNVYNLA